MTRQEGEIHLCRSRCIFASDFIRSHSLLWPKYHFGNKISLFLGHAGFLDDFLSLVFKVAPI